MSAKFTPGPWEREIAQDGEYTGPGDNPPGYAGDLYETTHVGRYDETGVWHPGADCYNAADAQLVKAAPELLAACRYALSIVRLQPDPKLGEWNWPQIAAQLEAAIRKATQEGQP